MKLYTASQYRQLLRNGHLNNREKDHFPVVKLFTPDAAATWLLTEIDPNEPDMAFGLCDLGLGYPELGNFYLPEIRSFRGCYGLPVERDFHFEATHPISVYAEAARQSERIITNIDNWMQPQLL